MSDLIDEIKQDLKEESKEKIIKKYFPYFCLIIAISLIATYFIIRNNDLNLIETEKNEISYAHFLKNGMEPHFSENDHIFKNLTKFKKAQKLIDESKFNEAAKTYEEISQNSEIDPTLKEFAQIQIIKHELLIKENFQDEKIIKMISNLESSEVWKIFAINLEAIRLYKIKNFKKSLEKFQEVHKLSDLNSHFYKQSEAAIAVIKTEINDSEKQHAK